MLAFKYLHIWSTIADSPIEFIMIQLAYAGIILSQSSMTKVVIDLPFGKFSLSLTEEHFVKTGSQYQSVKQGHDVQQGNSFRANTYNPGTM